MNKDPFCTWEMKINEKIKMGNKYIGTPNLPRLNLYALNIN